MVRVLTTNATLSYILLVDTISLEVILLQCYNYMILHDTYYMIHVHVSIFNKHMII